jgi:deoxyribonuclease V
MLEWPDSAEALDAEQRRVSELAPAPWSMPRVDGPPVRVGGVFLAYGTGKQGPGHAGDPGWAGAAVVEVPGFAVVACAVVAVPAGAPYAAGLLALREGPALAAALEALPVRPDVVLVDATGRDHPRRAGLALHLGAVADVPTVGVTHRPLLATGSWPPEEAGASAPLGVGDEVVGAWLRTTATARPLAVHAAWRSDVETAVEVVRRSIGTARTPEPLREARVAARTARAEAEGRIR